MMSTRECGALEVMDDLCGHPNFEFDRGHTFIPNVSFFSVDFGPFFEYCIFQDPTEKRVRVLKSADLLSKLKENEKCSLDNMNDDYYPNRGPELEDYSLFNIMTNFDVVASVQTS